MPELVDVVAVVFAIAIVAPVFWLVRPTIRKGSGDAYGGDAGSGDGWTDHGHHGGHSDAGGHSGDGGGDGGGGDGGGSH